MSRKTPTPDPAPRWASIAEASLYGGWSEKTTRRKIADGTIPARRFGSRIIRVDLNDVDAAMRPIPSAVMADD